MLMDVHAVCNLPIVIATRDHDCSIVQATQ